MNNCRERLLPPHSRNGWLYFERDGVPDSGRRHCHSLEAREWQITTNNSTSFSPASLVFASAATCVRRRFGRILPVLIILTVFLVVCGACWLSQGGRGQMLCWHDGSESHYCRLFTRGQCAVRRDHCSGVLLVHHQCRYHSWAFHWYYNSQEKKIYEERDLIISSFRALLRALSLN